MSVSGTSPSARDLSSSAVVPERGGLDPGRRPRQISGLRGPIEIRHCVQRVGEVAEGRHSELLRGHRLPVECRLQPQGQVARYAPFRNTGRPPLPGACRAAPRPARRPDPIRTRAAASRRRTRPDRVERPAPRPGVLSSRRRPAASPVPRTAAASHRSAFDGGSADRRANRASSKVRAASPSWKDRNCGLAFGYNRQCSLPGRRVGPLLPLGLEPLHPLAQFVPLDLGGRGVRRQEKSEDQRESGSHRCRFFCRCRGQVGIERLPDFGLM